MSQGDGLNSGLKVPAIALALVAVVLVLLGTTPALAERPAVVSSRGQTVQIKVPVVSQPWSATLGVASSARQKQTRFIGHYPRFSAGKRQANRRALRHTGRQTPSSAAQTSSLAPLAPTSSAVVFDGPSESDTPYIAPDSQIAAGPTYLVVVINSLMAIYDKTGVQQGSLQQLGAFFSSLGLTGEFFDPRIIYDQTDQRFILTAAEMDFTGLTNGHVVIAVSDTNDPTQTWHKWALNFMGRDPTNTTNTFPDFPTLGLSNSAVYVATNQFELTQSCLSTDADNCQFSDAWVTVIGLPGLISPASNPTLTVTTFRDVQTAAGQLAFSIQPALTYGAPGSEFLAAADFSASPNNTLNLFSIPTTGTPTLNAVNMSVPSFALPPDAQQAGSSNLIASNDFRLLNAVWSNGYLFCGQNVADSSGANAVARWYEIQASDLGSASLSQSGSVSGTGEAYYPAISIKADGMVGMGFTTSSNVQPASAAYTARETSDAPGTMRSYSIYQAGTTSYDESIGNRWGDYSGISEDPDGGSLWTIAEYAGTPDPHFGTAIAQTSGPPEISSSPGSLRFGAVPVGSRSTGQTVTLTNISSNSVAISPITVAGPNAADFSVTADNCSNVSLNASQTCTLTLSFKPSANATEVAYLSIPYGGQGGLTTVSLSGFGAIEAVLTLSPSSVTFPNTAQQTASAPQVITLKNTGNASA